MNKKALNSFFVTAFTAAILALFLSPFLYMIFTSLKSSAQMAITNSPIWPAQYPTFVYKGENKGTYTLKVNKSGFLADQVIDMSQYVDKSLDVFTVPLEDGTKKDLALIKGYQ